MSLNKSGVGSLDKRKLTVFVPYNAKIADITEADTDKHTLDLAAALGETRKIIMIWFTMWRISGTGEFLAYSNEGTEAQTGFTRGAHKWIIAVADGTQRLQYSQSTANDDWDLYCSGYVVES